MEKRKNIYKRIIWIVIVLQVVFAIYCIGNLLKTKERICFTENNLNTYGGYFNDEEVYFVDEECSVEEDACVIAGPLSLQPGVYKVSFLYQTDVEQITSVKAGDVGYRKLYSNVVSLRPTTGLKECTYRFSLLETTDDLNIIIKYVGNGTLQVRDLTLVHTRQEYSMALVLALVLFSIVDFVLIYFGYYEKKLSIEEKNILLGIVAISMLSSLPLFVDYIIWGDDQYFHMSRIEGIARGWANGIFPVRMQTYMLEGMGYPTSIMYGDVFLWSVAFLRFVGFDLAVAYKAYILLSNIATALIGYFCFKNIFRDRYVGLWCSAIYTLSLYRLYNVYARSALGEYTAMIFWPVICWGLVRVLSKDLDVVKEQKTMWILVAGYMSVLYSHILSLELAIIFTMLVCLISYKRFFRKETFLILVKAALWVVGLSLWFIVPLLDYVLNVDMNVFHAGNPIQVLGLYLVQLFWIYPWSGSASYMYASGMQNVKAYGIGAGLVFVLFSSLYIWMQKRKQMNNVELYRVAKISAVVSICSCAMSLSLFPWDALTKSVPFIQSIVFAIQFPYRLLSIAIIALTILGGSIFLIIRHDMNRLRAYVYAGVVLFFTMMSALFFLEDNLQHKEWSDLREIASLGTKQIGAGKEYLPHGIDAGALDYFLPTSGENVELQGYEAGNNGVKVICRNNSTEKGYIDCGLIYYPGYEARDVKTGEQFEITSGNNYMLRVNIPSGYVGEIDVNFTGRTIWKVIDIFSVFLWIGSIASIRPMRRKCRR